MSTRTAITVVGTAIGLYFGNPQLGYVAGSMIGNAVDPQHVAGPQIGEIPAQTSADGINRPLVWGTTWVYGNVIQQGPIIKIEDESDTGKGGPEQGEGDKVYRTFAVRIAGPISGILRVWADNKLVYDVRPGSGMSAESAQWIANKVVYLGGEDQLPDPNLVAIDPDNTHAYRGTSYVVFVLEDLTSRGGSYPQFRWEVSTNVTTTPLDKVEDWENQGGFYAPIPSQYEGDISPVFENTEIFTSWFDVQVVQLEVHVYGVTSSSSTTFTIHWGSGKTTSGAIAGNGHYYVQLQKAIADSVTVDLNYQTIGDDTPYSVTVYARALYEPGEDLTETTAYHGGGAVPDAIYPDDPFYGVLTDPVLGYLSAPWGPEYFETVGGPVTLGSIVSDIHRRCDIPGDMVDVSELTQTVDGFSAAGDYSAADIITELRKVYFFDKSEHDKKLWYPLRGHPVVETLTVDDLTEVPDTTQREQATEVPKKLNLKYQHAASGYAPVKSTFSSSATDILTTGEASIETSVVMNEDQAAQTVQKMWKVARTDIGGEMVLSVPIDVSMKYVPGNCLGVSLRGIVTRERIEQMDFASGVIKLIMRPDRQSSYTSTLTGIPIPPPTLPPSTIVGDTEIAVLDASPRVDSEDELSYLVAVTGALPPWYGARYRRSLDGGANWTAVQDITAAAVMGVITADVAAASPHFTDTTNTVKVRLFREGATLESLTRSQFLSRQGVFALENADGSWESMQANDVAEQVDGSFWLTTLHRGIANSGGSAHAAGAKFVWLADATYLPASSSWIGLALTHQATSFGESNDDTTNDQTHTYVGRSQKEWPPAYLKLSRDGSNLVTATWEGCGRFGNAFNPVMSRNFTGYRVTVTDGSTTTVTETTSTTYTGTWANPVTVSVVALNRITGAGPATSGTV